jgi:hypothetical protein
MKVPTREQIDGIAVEACERLRAIGCESVVLVATFPSEDDAVMTSHYKVGRGNYYAQRGSVIEWIDQTRAVVLENPPVPPTEDGEWWKG